MIALLRDIFNVCVALAVSPVARRIFARIVVNRAHGAAKVGGAAILVLAILYIAIGPAPDAPTTAPAPVVVEDSQDRQYHYHFPQPETDGLETSSSAREMYVQFSHIWTQPTWTMTNGTSTGTSITITTNGSSTSTPTMIGCSSAEGSTLFTCSTSR